MASFIIEGGHPLQGTITPQGAKNEALEVICATLLTSQPVTISNIPDIRDINNLIQLLREIGVNVTRESRHTYTFCADKLNLDFLESDAFVHNAAYLRCKNLQLGYTVPKRVSQKFFVENLKVYTSIDNLFTISSFPGLDPEIAANVGYPSIRQYSVGINVSF